MKRRCRKSWWSSLGLLQIQQRTWPNVNCAKNSVTALVCIWLHKTTFTAVFVTPQQAWAWASGWFCTPNCRAELRRIHEGVLERCGLRLSDYQEWKIWTSSNEFIKATRLDFVTPFLGLALSVQSGFDTFFSPAKLLSQKGLIPSTSHVLDALTASTENNPLAGPQIATSRSRLCWVQLQWIQSASADLFIGWGHLCCEFWGVSRYDSWISQNYWPAIIWYKTCYDFFVGSATHL